MTPPSVDQYSRLARDGPEPYIRRSQALLYGLLGADNVSFLWAYIQENKHNTSLRCTSLLHLAEEKNALIPL